MRIIHLNNHVGTGGAQRVMIDLAAGQVAAGHQVFTVASPIGEWWNEVPGRSMPVEALAGRHGSPLRILRTARALRRTLDTVFPDVVHVHQRPLALALRLAQIGRRRVAVVEHAHSLASGRSLVSYRWSDVVIAPGTAAATHVRSHFGHAAAKVVCIPNAVADPGPPHDRAASSGPIRLLAIGRVEAAKDPRWFVDLIAALRDLQVDVVGRWLGDGPERQAAAQWARDAGVTVDFPGRSPIVRLEIVAADLVVSSSVHEAMPISLLEALAGGRGIVAREVGSIAELVTTGVNGVVVNAGLPAQSAAAEIAAALGADPRDSVARWGRASRAQYERAHDPVMVGAAVIDVYRTAIEAHAQQLGHRSAGQVLLAPVAATLLYGCDVLLRVAGLQRALRVVGARGAWDDAVEEGPSAFAELGPGRLRLAWAVQRAGSGWRRSTGPCLRQALALSLVLRRYSPVIHFGVRAGAESPAAHAWATVGSLRFDRDHSYQPFMWQRPA